MKITVIDLLIFSVMCGHLLCSSLICVQKFSILNEELEVVCVVACFVNKLEIGNSNCTAFKTSLLLTYITHISDLRRVDIKNLTSSVQKNSYMRVFVNYFFKGVILKALLANLDSAWREISSTIECWLTEQDIGGQIQITVGGRNFNLRPDMTKLDSLQWTSAKWTVQDEVLKLLNERVYLDYYFLLNVCPKLADNLYRDKMQVPNFTVTRTASQERKVLVKTWKTFWSNWHKYREIQDIASTYGSNDIIFLDDYDYSVVEQSKHMNMAGMFFLCGGGFILLGTLCCLSIMRRRDLARDFGYS